MSIKQPILRCPFPECHSRIMVSPPKLSTVGIRSSPDMLVCHGTEIPTLESATDTLQFYQINDIWAFDNIGVSRSTDGVFTSPATPVLVAGEKIKLDRFLTCADCDKGPLGFAGVASGHGIKEAGNLDARVLQAQDLCYYLSQNTSPLLPLSPAMFTFESLVSPLDSSTRCSRLSFGLVHILADPGWDSIADLAYLAPAVAETHLILLSHPTAEYLGGYASLLHHYPVLKTIPTYSTLPVTNLGRVNTIDQYRSAGLIGPLDTAQFEVEDIEDMFDKILPLKHAQTTQLTGNFDNLRITPYNAGHTLGGTVWLLSKDNEKIVYAPAWNHSKDSFLNGSAFLQANGQPLPQLLRPTAVITNSNIGSALPHKKRTEKFLQLVDATLANGGSVLLPSSLGGRMLELIHLVDEHLQSAPIPVLMLAHTGSRVLNYAGSMLEWMAPAVIKDWELKNQVPFDASRVQLIEAHELPKFSGPKVVFAADSCFSRGTDAQACLAALCSDERTTILLTERTHGRCLAKELYSTWEALSMQRLGKLEDGNAVPFEQTLVFDTKKEEPLSGLELQEFKSIVAGRRREKAAAKNIDKKNKSLLSSDNTNILDESSDESSEEEDIKEVVAPTDEGLVDMDVRAAKGKHRMFPFLQKRPRYDDYGETIRHADYQKVEEKKFDRRKFVPKDVKPGQKRKWNDAEVLEKEKKEFKVNELDSLHNPRRVVYGTQSLGARCGLAFVDLAGLVDLRSMAMILPLLKPKKVVLLADVTEPRNQAVVYNFFSKSANFAKNGIDVLCVAVNEALEIGGANNSFEIRLDDELVKLLKWQNITGGYSISHVIGEVAVVERDTLAEDRKAEMNDDDDDDDDYDPEAKVNDNTELVLRPLSAPSTSIIQTQPLAVGDIRLSELKKRLGAANHRAEFKGEGTLVVNDEVIIRKVNDGNLIVDGFPGTLFYEVRESVRGMLGYVG
ncbi:hypothetical protein BABINDRAFT_8441 [Babjeviella inositovora NRRL Y-12698]|uniref:Beta-Casp domain-containing protein n=1 Tax=Babjeviella inositovora NRRL Y-12698 TaxID=984486 RepID=A0A1E3QPB3_9ASCO|nr:uncharacterized protein BABINDRAFT_8441 [Babjeviella inositovora NRRL Y-12698]ODQ79525.1 hypothetical protein BABINDRAFT_8441 [Babjeviella inositovora NRRL Y-12698]